MRGQKAAWWLAVALAALLGAGCSGVLLESKQEDGRVQRLRLDSGESWSTYDDKPRVRSQHRKDQDDLCIMLKNETTF